MNNIDILEEGIKKMIQDERIHDDYRNMITAISNLIAENKELKEKNEKIKQEYINPNKARISYFDYKKSTNVVIEGFVPKSKVEEKLRKAINNKIDLSKAMFEGDFTNGYIFALQSLLGKE